MARLGRSQPFPPTINRLIIIESATSYVLTGVSGAGSVGSVAVGMGLGLTQVSATGLVGTLPVSIGASLVGVSATGIPGMVSYAEMFPGTGGVPLGTILINITDTSLVKLLSTKTVIDI